MHRARRKGLAEKNESSEQVMAMPRSLGSC
jgi:hypothetical protein